MYTSIWRVFDAFNAHDVLKIKFPTDHSKQRKTAEGFKSKSWVGFDNCVGAVDGMLVWMTAPSKKVLKETKVGALKFFCGRKKKYGMNLQAICDSNRKFIDIEVRHPASTSDYLCFCTLDILKNKLSKDGFLAPGLAIYGDNAYINTPFLVTPEKGVSTGPEDAYNFFQSQLRINIECAFGMLVHRWGCLRKALPVNLSIEKVTALILCLCTLHNFCIDERGIIIPASTAADNCSITTEGGMRVNNTGEKEFDNSTNRVSELLDGGEIRHDIETRNERRRYEQMVLPKHTMIEHVKSLGYTQRPMIIRT